MEKKKALEIMQRRHSVRQYTAAPIEPEKRAALQERIAQINRETGLHIQIFLTSRNASIPLWHITASLPA